MVSGGVLMRRTEVIAHRGSKGTHPENTLPAFEEALKAGSDGIELDVQLSGDQELVVIHDETVDRTSDGHGLVGEFTLQELKTLDAGSWFASEYAFSRIPSLQEVFDLLNSYQYTGVLNIEFKTNKYPYPGIEEKVMELVCRQNWPFAIEYSSFNYQTLRRVKELDQSNKIALLFKQSEGAIEILDNRFPVTMWHPKLTWLREISESNVPKIPTRPWTVNHSHDLDYCFSKRTYGVITDYPAKALAIREKWQS